MDFVVADAARKLQMGTRAKPGMKVRAPFHVGTTYEQGWELFSFRAMAEWINEIKWDYYFSQRLTSQAERLLLRRDFEVWRSRRKYVNSRTRRAR